MAKKAQKITRNKFDGQLRFPITLRKEPEGGFTVFVPALPGCITFGKNIDEAQKMAKEAIELYLEDMIAHGESIPDESPLKEPFGFSKSSSIDKHSILHIICQGQKVAVK